MSDHLEQDLGFHLEQAPATAAADRGTCAHCPASAEGCAARQAARFGPCCRRCSHFSDGEKYSTPRIRDHPPDRDRCNTEQPTDGSE